MAFFDVFNGDADGICALHMLRLAEPREAQLVTGVKRDIALLERVEAQQGDRLCVLDISLDKNRAALEGLLARGVVVDYFDHHYAGEIPEHSALRCHLHTAANTCTGLIVHGYLQGAYAPWAIVAAFGDNMAEAAHALGKGLGLSTGQLGELQSLGECLNYNAYGESVADLFFHPAELYQRLHPWQDPFAMMREDDLYPQLREAYASDLALAEESPWLAEREQGAILLLPDAPWSRRVSGVFGNLLARREPARAHAVLTEKQDGGYQVSVRAPLQRREGADTFCRQFATGGGRAAAAGINHLPRTELEGFIEAFFQYWRM